MDIIVDYVSISTWEPLAVCITTIPEKSIDPVLFLCVLFVQIVSHLVWPTLIKGSGCLPVSDKCHQLFGDNVSTSATVIHEKMGQLISMVYTVGSEKCEQMATNGLLGFYPFIILCYRNLSFRLCFSSFSERAFWLDKLASTEYWLDHGVAE